MVLLTVLFKLSVSQQNITYVATGPDPLKAALVQLPTSHVRKQMFDVYLCILGVTASLTVLGEKTSEVVMTFTVMDTTGKK